MSLKTQLEALLYSSGGAMGEEQLADLTGTEQKDVAKALQQLQTEYDARESGIRIVKDETSWKMAVRDEHISLVRRIVAETELGRPTLETLAVIAYHHPKVLQSKIVDVRGGNAYEQIRELLDLGFITKEKEGRSFALRLAEKFFQYFDLEGEQIQNALNTAQVPIQDEQQKLAGLEVVEVPPEKEKVLEVQEEIPETVERPPRNHEGEQHWLDRVNSQIEELSRKNDENDQDEVFKRREEETQQEEGTEQESTTETVEEKEA